MQPVVIVHGGAGPRRPGRASVGDAERAAALEHAVTVAFGRLDAGALDACVAAVSGVMNPIRAARALLDEGETLLWAGRSPALIARYGLEPVDPAQMVTPLRDRGFERISRDGHSRRRAPSAPSASMRAATSPPRRAPAAGWASIPLEWATAR